MKKVVFITLLSIVALYYFLSGQETKPNDTKQEANNKPNIVSQVEEPVYDMVAIQAEVDRKQKVEMERAEQAWLNYLAGAKIDSLENKVSYLEAYRDYKYYDHCIMLIGNILYEMDPVAAVMDIMHSRVNEAYEILPEIQKEKVHNRIDKCVSLTHFNEHLYYPERVRNNLKLRMESITPKSIDEKELEVVLFLISQFEKSFYSVKRLKSGENIDHQLFFDLRNKINELERQYPQRLTLFGGYAEADLPLVNQLNEQIKAVEAQIEANKIYDKEALRVEEENLIQLSAELESKFFNVNSSDAYLVIKDLLNESRFESALLSIRQNIQQKLNLAPKEYSEFLHPILTKLRACELGHPCGLESVFAEEMCLDFTDNNSSKACGLSVLDYYLTHHLSPLELADIEFILAKGY